VEVTPERFDLFAGALVAAVREVCGEEAWTDAHHAAWGKVMTLLKRGWFSGTGVVVAPWSAAAAAPAAPVPPAARTVVAAPAPRAFLDAATADGAQSAARAQWGWQEAAWLAGGLLVVGLAVVAAVRLQRGRSSKQ